jgi:GrpE
MSSAPNTLYDDSDPTLLLTPRPRVEYDEVDEAEEEARAHVHAEGDEPEEEEDAEDEDAEEEAADDYDDEETEEEEDPGPGIQEVRDDIALNTKDVRDDIAASAQDMRRASRRTMDVLKELSTTLGSLSVMVTDLHSAERTGPGAASGSASEALSKDWMLALIELADRLSRLASAFRQPPAPATGWWPGAKAVEATWKTAWASQEAAVAIFQSHLEGLLTRAQLQRIPTEGQQFDPACMNAVEAQPHPTAPDHSVLAELLPGWRYQNGLTVRPAHVRVARRVD